jgi:hypothetical protein
MSKKINVQPLKNGMTRNILYLLPLITSLLRLLLLSYRLTRVEGAGLEKEALARSGGKAVYCSCTSVLFFTPGTSQKGG